MDCRLSLILVVLLGVVSSIASTWTIRQVDIPQLAQNLDEPDLNVIRALNQIQQVDLGVRLRQFQQDHLEGRVDMREVQAGSLYDLDLFYTLSLIGGEQSVVIKVLIGRPGGLILRLNIDPDYFEYAQGDEIQRIGASFGALMLCTGETDPETAVKFASQWFTSDRVRYFLRRSDDVAQSEKKFRIWWGLKEVLGDRLPSLKQAVESGMVLGIDPTNEHLNRF